MIKKDKFTIKVEKETLKTFMKEIPSILYSDKKYNDYLKYKKLAEHYYTYQFKFPPKMFNGCELIDFGAGTGENTLYLSDWGAKCTLVEMNPISYKISKKLFKKYSKNYYEHKFINQSIFDFKSKKKYDIVHCRGVLSHTNKNKELFKKISTFIKPGGYIIYGDPNKFGGFQNMLQRLIVYKFTNNDEEMVKICEYLFKDDIDRSQNYSRRTRRSIIFDRWVIQKQNDPSVTEVLKWFKKNNIKFYNCYPPISNIFETDSVFNYKKTEELEKSYISLIQEIKWMSKKDDDKIDIYDFKKKTKKLSNSKNNLEDYLADCNINSSVKIDQVIKKIKNFDQDLKKFDFNIYAKKNIYKILTEIIKLLKILKNKDLIEIKNFLKKCDTLFKGYVGVRHVDYIGQKLK